MIITKECYKIVDANITVQNDNKSVWAIIPLKDLSKLVIGSFYRPPNKDIQPLVDLEIELAQISEKFKNNPKTTLILGSDFNAGGINWDLCTVDHDQSWGQASVKPREASVENSSLYVILRNDTMFVFFTMLIG